MRLPLCGGKVCNPNSVSPTTPPIYRRRDLSRLSLREFRLRERRLLFHKAVEDTARSDAPYGVPAGGGSVRPVYPVTFSLTGCRLPELEGSVISFLGRIASLLNLSYQKLMTRLTRTAFSDLKDATYDT